MVASQLLAMGNGSVKAPRAEENSCLPSIHADAPHLDSDILRLELHFMFRVDHLTSAMILVSWWVQKPDFLLA